MIQRTLSEFRDLTRSADSSEKGEDLKEKGQSASDEEANPAQTAEELRELARHLQDEMETQHEFITKALKKRGKLMTTKNDLEVLRGMSEVFDKFQEEQTNAFNAWETKPFACFSSLLNYSLLRWMQARLQQTGVDEDQRDWTAEAAMRSNVRNLLGTKSKFPETLNCLLGLRDEHHKGEPPPPRSCSTAAARRVDPFQDMFTVLRYQLGVRWENAPFYIDVPSARDGTHTQPIVANAN